MDAPKGYGLTFNLIMTSDGKKMGKSEKGAVYLDKDMYSVYDFYQYWRNVQDSDVIKLMKLFTFMELDEIAEYEKPGVNINDAKARLAFEVTSIIHGREEAEKAESAAKALFSSSGSIEGMPSVEVAKDQFEMGVLNLFTLSGLTSSNGDARRLVVQGGAEINGRKITDPKTMIKLSDANEDGAFILKAGKKRYMRVIVK